MEVLVNNLNFGYSDKQVLNNINLHVSDGQVVLILGHNGAGKTTLIKCLLNKLNVDKQTILIDNVDINEYNNWSKIGYVPQDVEVSGFPISVFEFLLAFNKHHNKKEVTAVLEKLNIAHLKDKNIKKLSGGEKRRTFIARALLNDIELLIMDEPMVAIDEKSIDIVKKLIESISYKKIPIIIITHNFGELKDVATHVLVMEQKVKFYGTTDEYLRNTQGV